MSEARTSPVDGPRGAASLRTIVFLCSDYEDYARSLVEAARDVAERAGYGLLCVIGGDLVERDTERLAVRNGIYRLIDSVDVAGILCDTGMLGHRVDPATVVAFLQRYRQPCVSLGHVVPGMPCVVADDRDGMSALMSHLLADDRRQRLAFVRGVQQDVYSLEREGVFRDALSSAGRTVDEALFVAGDYDAFTAYEAVAELLLRAPDIDAIVAANDAMALSAARAVVASGRTIPDDVAITGFDDVPDATRLSPALTTVRQPLADMAELGVAELLALIERSSHPRPHTVATDSPLRRVTSELVIRGSSVGHRLRCADVASLDVADLHDWLLNGLEGLKANEGVDLRELATALHATLTDGCAQLATLMTRVADEVSAADAHWWSNLCHCVDALAQRIDAVTVPRERVALLLAAMLPVRERVWAVQMQVEFRARRSERLRSGFQLRIGSSSDEAEVLAAVDGWVAATRPRRMFLVRFDVPAAHPGERGWLLRAHVDGRSHPQAGEPAIAFDTQALLPDRFTAELTRGALVMGPVYAGDCHYGYLMVDPLGVDVSGLDAAGHSIGNALRSRYLIQELERQASRLQRANAELSSQANRDALTGLANRLCFDQRLHEACERGEPFGLCFLDLDGFKGINDELGHAAGDALLCELAERLERVVANTLAGRGFAARLGGDEFTLIFTGTVSVSRARQVAEAALATLCEPVALAGGSVRITVSIGGALFPEHGRDASTLLRHADIAMYRAKAAGKNRSVVYGDAAADAGPLPLRRVG